MSFQCLVDVGFWGGICGSTISNVKNIRPLLRAGVAGFKCNLNTPDGTCGGKYINQLKQIKLSWPLQFEIHIYINEQFDRNLNYTIKVQKTFYLALLLTPEGFQGWT